MSVQDDDEDMGDESPTEETDLSESQDEAASTKIIMRNSGGNSVGILHAKKARFTSSTHHHYANSSLPSRKAELPIMTARFVGRGAELKDIEDNLKVGAIVVLTGIASIGKSQAARKFCDLFQDKNPGTRIFWLQFDTMESCEASFRSVARELKIPGVDEHAATDVKPHVKDWLSKPENYDTWLLILDNSNNSDVFKAAGNCIPFEHGRVLVTSQSAGNPNVLRNEKKPYQVKIDRLARGDAEVLFRSLVPPDFAIDIPVLDDLLAVLEHHPLGIVQAGTYLKESGRPVADYTRLMRHNDYQFRDWMSGYPFEDGEEHRLQTLGSTLEMQFDRLLQQTTGQNQVSSPEVIPMLAQIGCLYSQCIPHELFLPPEGSSNRFSCEGALKILRAQSLVNDTSTGALSMQRIVKIALQIWLRREGNEAHLRAGLERAATALAVVFPKGEFRQWAACEAAYPHGLALLQFKNDYFPSGSDSDGDSNDISLVSVVGANAQRRFADVLFKMAWYEWRRGDYGLAANHADIAYEIQSHQEEGEDDPAALESKTLQGRILHHHGRYDDAREKFDSVIETLKQGGGGREKNRARKKVIEVSRFQASTLVQLGMFGNAKTLLAKALAQREALLREARAGKDDDAEVLEIEDQLACVLLDRGDAKEAEKKLRYVLERQKVVLKAPLPKESMGSEAKTGTAPQEEDQEHPSTLATMVHLAEALAAQECYEDAEKELRSALALYEARNKKEGRTTGDPDSLICMNVLGGVLQEQKRYAEAEEMFARVVESFEAGVGAVGEKCSGQRVPAMINLADMLQAQGKTDQLRPRLAAMASLAASLENNDRLDDAEHLHLDTLRFRIHNLPRHDPDSAESWAQLHQLSQAYWDNGRKLGAIRLRLVWYFLCLYAVILLPCLKRGR
ncbi:hypothetical protein EDB80DRAFT_808508 [Ilyonectria destructans]|nr:hypothetical protein EDB80DRAFT_808508 [Ilyonectria destructans]